EGLKLLQDDFGLPVVYPIHPRARRRMQEHGLNSDSLTIVEPFDYFSFLQLESKARLILTDSGGVQEEACIKSHASPSGIILRGLKPWMLARTLSLEQSLRTFSRRPGS
ncbi:MAG: UDP-N-acetylglucosamine 2-epimerase, partial [Thermoproteota archaeon]